MRLAPNMGGPGVDLYRRAAQRPMPQMDLGRPVRQAMLSTIPPSTRKAAPVVALACGEAA